MMMNAICYKVKNAIVYNKGTKYEAKHDTFLAYYTTSNDVDAQAEVDKLNSEMPMVLPNGMKAPEDVEMYFLNKQEEMY